MREQSLFDSFNARYLRPEQVGEGFIYSNVLDTLLERSHSILVGPRGSGKTTLLKMLRLPALLRWQNRTRRKLLRSLSFAAFYVPADALWSPEYRNPTTKKLSQSLNELFSSALFRHSVLVGLCDLLEDVTNPGLSQDKDLQRFYCNVSTATLDASIRAIADSWALKPELGGLEGLRAAVKRGIVDLQEMIVRSSLSSEAKVDDVLEKNPKLTRNYSDDISSFIDVLEALQTIEKYHVCGCFDELEIAPVSLRKTIVRTSRSVDQRLLIRISASPFDDGLEFTSGSDNPSAGNDYKLILLTNLKDKAARDFGSSVFEAIAEEQGLGGVAPEKLLEEGGYSLSARDEEEGKSRRKVESSYGLGSRNALTIQRLSSEDVSFRAFLARNSLNRESIAELTENRRAAKVRKWIGIASVRSEFLAQNRREAAAGTSHLRSRKTVPEFYTGYQAIIDMCEGNPRWLIGTLRPLMIKCRERRDIGDNRPLPSTEQAAQIRSTIIVYFSLLSNIRLEGYAARRYSTAVALISEIGEYFQSRVLGDDFDPEPVLSFRLDSEVDPSIRSAVGRMINQGAFVLIREQQKPIELGRVDGQRYRLTYLLSPAYKLPLSVGRAISLATVLERAKGQETPILLQYLDLEE